MPSPEPLHTALLDTARAFAGSAVTTHVVDDPAGDWRFTVLHAATASEQALKALLAFHSPSLVAARDRDSLLHAAGLPQAARGRMKTVTPAEALATSLQLDPGLLPYRIALERLMEIRNGVVHLSSSPPADLDSLLTAFLGAVEQILTVLSVDRVEFWGTLSVLVQHRLADHANEVRAQVEEKVEAAKVRYKKQFASFSADQLQALRSVTVATHAASPERFGSDQATTLVDCPACGSPAFVTGSLDVSWELEEMSWLGHVGFHPFSFRCPACELELEGEQVLEAGVEPDAPRDVSPYDISDPPDLFDVEGLRDEDLHPPARP